MEKVIVKMPYKGNVQTWIEKDGSVAFSPLTVEEYLKDNPGCVVMTWDELEKVESDYWVSPFTEITAEIWDDMLEVLPPMKWHNVSPRYNVFFIMEATSGHYHSMYLRDRETKKYYSCTESKFITDEKILEKIAKEIK